MNLLKTFETEALLRKKILSIIFLIIVITGLIEIWVVNRLSTYGEQINKLSQTKNHILLENQILQNQIAQKSSLQEIEHQAQTSGFENIKNIEYINSP